MKRLSIIFFFATFFCLTSIGAFAQNVIYLDADKKPATVANHVYKRVIKLEGRVTYYPPTTSAYGTVTVTPNFTGFYRCSVNDFYKTGEPALVANIISPKVDCSEGFFEGAAVIYYKNGNIQAKILFKDGKMHGESVFYDERGNELLREEYVEGKLIDKSKFSVSADNPMVGTWKDIEYLDKGTQYGQFKVPPTISRESTYIYSQNGIVESIHNDGLITSSIKGNWKYISKSSTSGVLEEYRGEDLIERGNVKFLNRNKIEYTVTYARNSEAIGKQYVWTRQ